MGEPSYVVYYSDELNHHGILGQKWGVRRYQNKDGTLTYAGKERQKSSSNKKKELDENFHNDETDKVKSPAVLAIISTLTLNPIGLAVSAKETAEIIHANHLIKKYEKIKLSEIEDGKLGFKLKSNADASMEEDAKAVNPGYKNAYANTKNNCMLCSIAYDMRRRGYDVQAKKASTGYTDNVIKEVYKKAKLITPEACEAGSWSKGYTKERCEALSKELVSHGEGSRGIITIVWRSSFSGHAMSWEVKDGRTKIIDPQSGKVYDDPYKVMKNAASTGTVYARTDNLKPDNEYIKKAVE